MNFYMFKLVLDRLKLTDKTGIRSIFIIFKKLEQIKIYLTKFVS
jgi:hypothetical protein